TPSDCACAPTGAAACGVPAASRRTRLRTHRRRAASPLLPCRARSAAARRTLPGQRGSATATPAKESLPPTPTARGSCVDDSFLAPPGRRVDEQLLSLGWGLVPMGLDLCHDVPEVAGEQLPVRALRQLGVASGPGRAVLVGHAARRDVGRACEQLVQLLNDRM